MLSIFINLILFFFIKVPYFFKFSLSIKTFFELLIKQEKNGEFYELMLQLHQMWGGLTKGNRNNIFRYLQILNWTAEKYLSEYLEAKK